MQLVQTQPGLANRSLVPVESGRMSVTVVTGDTPCKQRPVKQKLHVFITLYCLYCHRKSNMKGAMSLPSGIVE